MTTPVSLHDEYGLGTEVLPATDTGLAEPTVGHSSRMYRITAGGRQVWSDADLVVVPGQGISVVVLAPSEATDPT